jgi:ubiquinone/menaquinone biosynthesis C-methylase UbiE
LVGHIRKKVVSESSLPQGARVLDMACGTGAQSIAFAKRGFSVVGVDLSPDMLARARKKVRNGYDVTFLCQDASSVPFSEAQFDLATISFGLHDMPEEIGTAVLKEMRRVTKPNGKIVIVDYDVPKKNFAAFLGRAVAKMWEGKYYDHFLKVGLEHYLDVAQLSIGEKENFMFANIQKVICTNRKRA